MIPGDCVCGHDRGVHNSYGCRLSLCTCVEFEAPTSDAGLEWVASMTEVIAEQLSEALGMLPGWIWFDLSELL